MKIEVDVDHGDDATVRLRFSHEDEVHEVYYKSSDAELVPNLEAFTALALLPCMKQGWDLVVDEPLDPLFSAGIEIIQDTWCGWRTTFQKIDVVQPAGKRGEVGPVGEGVGSFFTGGLDSFYTFLKHQDEITDLIFVYGFDVAVDDQPLREQVSAMLERVGAEFGKRIIQVESNLRRPFLESYTKWVKESHGAGLASVGHLLSSRLHKIYVPSSFSEGHDFAWGSHPDIDPHWSTQRLEFVHDGTEADRIDKAAFVARSDLALKSLRVCFENRKGSYNCGECEKCIRTMINLSAVGALDRCTTFATPLTTEKIERLLAVGQASQVFFEENLRAIERHGGNPEIERAIRRVLGRPRWLTRTLSFIQKRRRRGWRKR